MPLAGSLLKAGCRCLDPVRAIPDSLSCPACLCGHSPIPGSPDGPPSFSDAGSRPTTDIRAPGLLKIVPGNRQYLPARDWNLTPKTAGEPGNQGKARVKGGIRYGTQLATTKDADTGGARRPEDWT